MPRDIAASLMERSRGLFNNIGDVMSSKKWKDKVTEHQRQSSELDGVKESLDSSVLERHDLIADITSVTTTPVQNMVEPDWVKRFSKLR